MKLLLEAGANVNRVFTRGTALDIVERNTKLLEEKLSGATDRMLAVVEDRLRRCKEIETTLRKFGAKRKSELPEAK